MNLPTPLLLLSALALAPLSGAAQTTPPGHHPAEPAPHPAAGRRFVPPDVDWEHPVYENAFTDAGALRDWRLEGGKRLSVRDGRLVLESEPPGPAPTATSNPLVCWLAREMPADFLLEFKVCPRDRSEGLNIVFFNARGLHGENIFDPALAPRSGIFAQYHSGDLNNYHISYWAGGRGTANVRKNKGFALVATGPDLVAPAPRGPSKPSASTSAAARSGSWWMMSSPSPTTTAKPTAPCGRTPAGSPTVRWPTPSAANTTT